MMLLAQTLGEILGIAGVALTLLGTLGGFVWWLASLHGTVKSVDLTVTKVATDVKGLVESQTQLHNQLLSHTLVCDHDHQRHKERLKELENQA